jgi:hypothetical protein
MIKNWEKFNENNELPKLLEVNSGDSLKEFLTLHKYKNVDTKFSFDKMIVIDSGTSGLIYTYTGDNFFYKLTYDKNSYLLARKLVGKKLKHLVYIDDVDVIVNNVSSLYIIKMEECEFLPEAISLIFENYNDVIIGYIKDMETNPSDFSDESNYDENYSKENALKDIILFLWEDDFLTDDDLDYLENIDFFEQLKVLKQELKSLGFTKYHLDIHYRNVMMRKNTDDICLIDFLTPKNFIRF